MPKNTQMHMQWITVNGQSVPLVLPQYWDGEKWVISSKQNPLPVKAELTRSNVEVFFDKIIPSEQTNNLFVGERTSSGIAGMTAIDISKYRKISIYIKNNTERPVLLRRLYFGLTADFRSNHIDNSGTNDIEIANDEFRYITADTENGLSKYLFVELPFLGIHLIRADDQPMSTGNFDIKLIGIK